jgi:hypothetical protein
MVTILDQRAQLFQAFGGIATSAAEIADEGINKAVQTDSTSVNTALKLFGGFDRSEFESIHRSTPNLLVPAVRPPASYEGPAEYFKPLSNTTGLEGLLVPVPDLLRQLADSQFRMSDGLSGFSDHKLTQDLQKGMILNSKAVPQGNELPQPGLLEAFGKLYTMENTVAKQLQLHDQLNFGALGRLTAPAPAPLPRAESPKLNQPLKDRPVLSATPAQQDMVNLLDHALNGTPQTTGELLVMVDALQAELEREMASVSPDDVNHDAVKNFCQQLLESLSAIENSAKNQNPNLPPEFDTVYQLQGIQILWKNAGVLFH